MKREMPIKSLFERVFDVLSNLHLPDEIKEKQLQILFHGRLGEYKTHDLNSLMSYGFVNMQQLSAMSELIHDTELEHSSSFCLKPFYASYKKGIFDEQTLRQLDFVVARFGLTPQYFHSSEDDGKHRFHTGEAPTPSSAIIEHARDPRFLLALVSEHFGFWFNRDGLEIIVSHAICHKEKELDVVKLSSVYEVLYGPLISKENLASAIKIPASKRAN
jgi:hypothetical protein